MTRQEAFQTLQLYTKSQNLIRHHFAVEAAMRALAQHFASHGTPNINIDNWGLAGLLHDADYEITRKTPKRHTLYLEEKLGNALPRDVAQAIKSHNGRYTNVSPQNLMDWSLYAVDELTGLIILAALSLKSKQLTGVTGDMVMTQLTDKKFAKTPKYAQIMTCETQLQLPIREFIEITLNSMKPLAQNLGFV